MRVRAFLLILFLAVSAKADDAVLAAVASNFAGVAEALAITFKAETGIEVRVSRGSTGKLYAQVVNGAPFQVFLAADVERPRLLEKSGHAVAGSRFSYATGSLSLWSRTVTDCLAALEDARAGHVAMANPATAPYGRAAKEFLVGIGAWDDVSPRAVYGQNILQVLQIASTGSVAVALIARPHVDLPQLPDATCTWDVPVSSHGKIDQQAVLLDPHSEGARRFLEFLRSDNAQQFIQRAGFGVVR